MQGFFAFIFSLFLSPLGILVLAALDSSMFFFMPVAIDTAVVIMSAREKEWFWIFPLMAAAGSLIGAAVTFAFGAKIGEAGLQRWIPERRLKKVRIQLGRRGVVAMGMMALLPPPFPLTPFVLVSGALGLEKGKFFGTFGVMRFIRFSTISVLAMIYGRQILTWLESGTFEYVIAGLLILAMVGTAFTIARAFRRTR